MSAPPTLTMPELEARIEGFVREHLREKSPETIGTYRRSLRAFQQFVADSGGSFRFTREGVLEYRLHLSDRGMGAATVSTYLTALRRLCDYLQTIGILEANPATGVRGSSRPDEHSRSPLTPEEVERLLEVADDDSVIGRRDRAIAYCMAYAGLSEIEIVRADVKDLEQTLLGWMLRVQAKGRKSKDLRVPLEQPVVDAIQAYLGKRRRVISSEALFVSHGRRSEGQRLNTRSVRSRINSMLRAAGLKRQGVSPHSLTHAAPVLWLAAGLPIDEIRRRMRHGTIETTRLYLQDRDKGS